MQQNLKYLKLKRRDGTLRRWSRSRKPRSWPTGYIGDGEAQQSALIKTDAKQYKVFNIYINSIVTYAEILSSNMPQKLT